MAEYVRPVYAGIGSISSGTLRPVDLIPNFLWELERLAKRAGTTDTHADLIADANRWVETEDNEDDDEGAEIVDGLATALEDFAPPYFYFGTHPGDGADFGFWLGDIEGSFDGLRISDTAEVPAGYQGEVLHVNDHGNMTLFFADGSGNLTEIWGIV